MTQHRTKRNQQQHKVSVHEIQYRYIFQVKYCKNYTHRQANLTHCVIVYATIVTRGSNKSFRKYIHAIEIIDSVVVVIEIVSLIDVCFLTQVENIISKIWQSIKMLVWDLYENECQEFTYYDNSQTIER